MHKLADMSLPEIIQTGWDVGSEIDLEGIGYGRIHWGNHKDVKETPGNHYYFLAGLVKAFGFKRILEIGTHCGGSTRAMREGFADQDSSRIVTMDITRESNKYLKKLPNIVKIVGDSNKPKLVQKVFKELEGQSIDFLLVDADHKFISALSNYAIYTGMLRPKVVCLDDVTLNDEMKQTWEHVQAMVPKGDAMNAVDLIPEIRPGNPGFGCVVLRNNL